MVKTGLITTWQAEQLLDGRVGFFLGPYRLLDALGSGTMGSVYRAERKSDGSIVALKVLSGALVHHAEAVARFLVEIRATMTLRHPNIITAIDADRDGHRLWMAMEYIEGRDVKTWLKERGALSIALACEVCRQAALGLHYAHENGMVHRDIKPANLLLTRDPKDRSPVIKILDLGMARFVGESTQRLTQSGQMMGTPDYISPEQAKNTKYADARSDVFSLGCSLFELLTGRLPFSGANMVQKLMARVNQTAPAVVDFRKDVPPALSQALATMLAREPADRYATALAAAKALAPFSGTSFE